MPVGLILEVIVGLAWWLCKLVNGSTSDIVTERKVI